MVNFLQGVSSNPREVNIHVTGLISKRNVYKYKSVMHKKYKHFKDVQKEIIKRKSKNLAKLHKTKETIPKCHDFSK